MIIFILII